ncbi:MAG: hypothetical protein AAFV29_16600, partial [Myxococcota bacterium]
YAAQGEAGDLRLRRILVEENAAPSYQPSLIPLPDDGDDRSISSTDGLRVDLTSGAFKFSVGNGEQCLRLSDSSRTSRFIAINGTSDTSLSLTPPGIGEAIALGSREWAVAGFPGQIDTSEPPGQEPIQLPAGMGAVSALSVTADRNAVVLHGTDRTVRIARVTQIFGARNLFGCPIFIPHPPGLVGPIVAAGRQHFALMTDGVLRLDADGTPLERGTVGVTYDTSFRLERRAGLDGGDLAIAYQPGERPIWVFAEGRDPFKIDLEAPILATLDGPQVILQPSANTLTVRTISDPNIFTAIDYQIPAFDDQMSAPLKIAPDAIVDVAGTTLIGFSQGAYVGALDLRTGLSQGFRLFEGVEVESILVDEVAQSAWLFTRGGPSAATRDLVQVPLPPAQ